MQDIATFFVSTVMGCNPSVVMVARAETRKKQSR